MRFGDFSKVSCEGAKLLRTIAEKDTGRERLANQPNQFSNLEWKVLNTDKLLTNKVTTIYKMQKILQLKDIYNHEVSKFMFKYTTSQLLATFNNYFKLITDVHSYNTRPIKTQQFALPKPRSNSGAKMITYRAIEICSKIPPEIKNKTCLALFLAEYKKYVLLSY